jgi:thiamine biosynthesis lipoprotein
MKFLFEAIGTAWKISFEDTLSEGKQQMVRKAIQERILAFDKTYSRFRSDSLVSTMAKEKGRYRLPVDAEPLLKLYRELYILTDGKFTPLIGQVLVDAGYDEKYSLQPRTLRSPLPWDAVLDYKKPYLTLNAPALLDFGAGGKGYLVDIVGKVLENEGITSFTINAGGDILQHDTKDALLKVGLEDPGDVGKVVGVASVCNQSICASAGNRRKWSTYHHIIDPVTLTSPSAILSAWVIADTGLLADALATCLFFVSPTTLLRRFSFEYVILYEDYSFVQSKGFRGELFVERERFGKVL